MNPNTYELIFNDIRFSARIGVCDHEREGPQEVIVHLKLTAGWDGKDVVLEDIVDFKWAVDRVKAIVLEKHWDLVETLCATLGKALMEDTRILIADVTLLKTQEIKEAKEVGARYVFTR